MTFVLPLVALALAALGWFVSRGGARSEEEVRFDYVKGISFIVFAVLITTALAQYLPAPDRIAVDTGVILGLLALAFGQAIGGWIAPLALGTAAASGLHMLLPTTVPAAQMALIAGVGLGTLVYGKGGEATAIAAILVVAADNLGMRHSDVPNAAYLGSELGLAATVGALLAFYVPAKIAPVKPVLIGVLSLIVATFFFKLGEGGLVVSVGIGALAGVVLHWLFGEEEAPLDAVRIGLAAVIGVGLATITFGLGRGAGMALALVAAGGVLLGVGNRRAMLALGPLIGLVLFRVLREAGTGATRALDIGQHYTLLALILGAFVPLLPWDWLKKSRQSLHTGGGILLWSLLVLAIPPLVILMFGMRGAIGFVVGLGLSGMVQALRGEKSLMPLTVGAGMAGMTILALTPLAEKMDMSRDEKVHLFALAGVGILVVAALLALLSRSAKEVSQ
ncbi:hypothetical protein BH11ARM2_BH11ARM2_19190 [soil metagenome]